MSDPAVTTYLTKLLCSYGGRLEKNRLADLLDLPEEQIEQILQDEPLRFPQTSKWVLARYPLRICTIYLYPKNEEDEEKCPKLHLCRDYLKGQCPPNRRPHCRLSHDVLTGHNHTVLKANELSGLDVDEIKVLLLQNDSQLLPEICRKYMYNKCDQGEDCIRLHVCSNFMQGICNSSCKRSHNLLESKLLMTCSWLSQETIQNVQMLCKLTHKEKQQALKKEPRNEGPRSMRGMSRGRGRGRPGDQRARTQDPPKNSSRKRRNKGLHINQQYTGGQSFGAEKYSRDGENDNDDRNVETKLQSLMDDWFTLNTSSLENVQDRSSATFDGVTPQEGTKSVSSSKPGIIPSIISAKPCTVSIKSENSSIKSPSTPKQMPVKELGEEVCSPVAELANINSIQSSDSKSSYCSSESPSIAKPKPKQTTSAVEGNLESSSRLPSISNPSTSTRADTPSRKHQTDVKPKVKPDAASEIEQPKPTNSMASKPQHSTNICSVKPQKWLHINQQYTGGQSFVAENYSRDGEKYYDDRNVETKLQSLMDDWFSLNTSPLENVQDRSPATFDEVTPQEGTKSVSSSKGLVVPLKLNDHGFPRAPLEISPKSYQPYTHAPYQTTDQTEPAVSLPLMYYNSSYTSRMPPRKGESLYQPTTLTAPSQPTCTTLKIGPSIASPGPLTNSSTSFNPSTEDPCNELKSLTGSARLSRLPTVSSIPSINLNKFVTSSTHTSSSAKSGIVPSIISAKTCTVSIKSEDSSIKSPSTPNQMPVKELPRLPSISNFSTSTRVDTPSRIHQTDVKPKVKPDAAIGIEQPKPTNSMASKPQHSTNIYSVKPQKSEKKLDELDTYTNNRQTKVISSILSSETQTNYLSNPSGTIMLTAANQKGILNYQKMKQMNDHDLREKEVRWSPGSLDFDRVKMLRGSIKSNANNSNQEPDNSASKVVNYPPTWDMKAMPEIGYQKILVPQMCDEFLNIAQMFKKTVQMYKVQKVWRVQNPTLWRAYQWHKDQMKKNLGINEDERQLFHGADCANITAICKDNFDWSLCGTNSTLYGQGNYFARDAAYAHNYSPANHAGTRIMFVARVLVGDFIQGDPAMRHLPQKYNSTNSYDSCVNRVTNPSIFVVFEKSQVYPEYILEYKKEKKAACLMS